ncbi:MAG: hypothetical protein ABIW38_00040, partial [Ferruginibacter sp.]
MSAKHLLSSFLFTLFVALSASAQEAKTIYSDYDRGYRYLYYQQLDSAYLMFNRYIINADDTLNKGRAYLFMGEMQWNIADLYGAQESLMGSIRTLDPAHKTHREFLGYTYNILGNVSLDLKQYDEAIRFYNKAMPFFTGTDYLPEVMNGKATALQKKGSYTSAIALYDSILAMQPAGKMLLARAIDNKAIAKWRADPRYPALPELQLALRIREDSQYVQGLNASYAHLSDYYLLSGRDSAKWYANKMLETAKQNKNADDMLRAIDKLVLLNNDATQKQHWHTTYKKINDSLQLYRDTTRNRFALIRYDVQKSKADNLVLKQHITRQRLIMAGLIALATLVITGLLTWYNKRRKRTQRENENAIRTARLKTSQKVHDVVANGLYGIMNELEHSDNIEREP